MNDVVLGLILFVLAMIMCGIGRIATALEKMNECKDDEESKITGGSNVLIERCHEAIGSEDGDSLLTSILNLIAKNEKLERERDEAQTEVKRQLDLLNKFVYEEDPDSHMWNRGL